MGYKIGSLGRAKKYIDGLVKFDVTNVLTNGNFAIEVDHGWGPIGGSVNVAAGSNQLTFTEDTATSEHLVQATQAGVNALSVAENKIYYRAQMVDNGGLIRLLNRKSDGAYESSVGNTIAVGNAGISHGILTVTSAHANPSILIRLMGASGSYLGTGAAYNFTDVMIINMTALGFNDRTAEEMGNLLDTWFDGTSEVEYNDLFKVRLDYIQSQLP